MDARGFVFHLPHAFARNYDPTRYGFIERLTYKESPGGWSDILNTDQRTALAAALQLILPHPPIDYDRGAKAIKTKIDKLITTQDLGNNGMHQAAVAGRVAN